MNTNRQMQLRITKAGLLSTVQDTGRYGHLAEAVPVSGAMDGLSARLANMAVGNPADAAVIEFTYSGDKLFAETDLLIAYSGSGSCFERADQIMPVNKPVFIPQGSELTLVNDTTSNGARVYLAVAGGWDVPDVLGSNSTCLVAGFGGFNGRALRAGDVLQSGAELSKVSQKILDSLWASAINYPKWQIPEMGLRPHQNLPNDGQPTTDNRQPLWQNIGGLIPETGNPKQATQDRQPTTGNRQPSRQTCIVRVIPANEFTWFNGRSIANFLTEPFRLGQKSNRMGYQLEGPTIERVNNSELLSTAVTPGTIQVTGNGSLILLMADCQTTGGYPRIAQVAAVDMPLCGQLKPGDELHFTGISWNDAEKLYIEREMLLRKIAIGIKNKYL